MESTLPKEDLTGLRAKGVSRINGTTGELVKRDNSLEDTAVREVFEEIGLKIEKNSLKLLSISSNSDENPIVHAVAPAYGIKLPNIPALKTIDTEFASDDMSGPRWFKVSQFNIEMVIFMWKAATFLWISPPYPQYKKQ